MSSTTPDARAGHGVPRRVRTELRYWLAWIGWTLLGAFGSASCLWCPGYGANDAWRSMRPRRPDREAGEDGVDRVSAREVARGLQELERYLAAAALDRRPPASSDRADPDGGTGAGQTTDTSSPG